MAEEKPRWESSGGGIRAGPFGQVPESATNISLIPAGGIPGRRPKMWLGGQWKSREATASLFVRENTSRTGRRGLSAMWGREHSVPPREPPKCSRLQKSLLVAQASGKA